MLSLNMKLELDQVECNNIGHLFEIEIATLVPHQKSFGSCRFGAGLARNDVEYNFMSLRGVRPKRRTKQSHNRAGIYLSNTVGHSE